MKAIFDGSPGWAVTALASGIDVMAKAALLILVVGLVDRMLGARRVTARASLWNACLVGLLLLPPAAISE